MKNKLIIISAPSGAGKTTLVHYLLSEIKLLEFAISCTTRNPRKNEINGKDYYFISIEEFKYKICNKEFIEFEEVYPNKFYGTLKSELVRIWNINKIVLFDVDVHGGLSIKNQFKNQSFSIFILPPNLNILKKRLLHRNTDSIINTNIRINKAKNEINCGKQFDYIIMNDNLHYAKKDIKQVINIFINSHK